jgi:hypothetical protein
MIATLRNGTPPKRRWRMKTQTKYPGAIAGLIYVSGA